MKLTDEEFVELYLRVGPAELARMIGYSDVRHVHRRRLRLEGELRRKIDAPDPRARDPERIFPTKQYPWRQVVEIRDGVVIIGSDFHYWPGDKPLMHRAMVAAIKEYKPVAVIANGDVMDFPTISKH